MFKDSTLRSGKKEGKAVRAPNLTRVSPLPRSGSVVVRLRCPLSLKIALQEAAKNRDCFKGSVNALVRDVMRSRYHRPEIPAPKLSERATARLTLRLTPEEWLALKDYAAAWGLPLWRALWLLAARPYTVNDRPTKRMSYTMSYTTEEERKERRENNLTVSYDFKPKGVAGRNKKPEKPVSRTTLLIRLFRSLGGTLSSRSDYGKAGRLFKRLWLDYGERTAACIIQTVCGVFQNPTPETVYHLRHFAIAKLHQWHPPSPTPSQREEQRQKVLARAEQIAETLKAHGLDAEASVAITPDGQPVGALRVNGRFYTIPDDLTDEQVVATFIPLTSTPEGIQAKDEKGGKGESMTNSIVDFSDEGNEPEVVDEDTTSMGGKHLPPFARPTPLKPSKPRSRAERAAEISAESEFAFLKPMIECPRCGRRSRDLRLKRYERLFPHIHDAEAERWNGKEVCFGDSASCFDSLRKGEVSAAKRAMGINTEPLASTSSLSQTHYNLLPPILPLSSEPFPTPLSKGKVLLKGERGKPKLQWVVMENPLSRESEKKDRSREGFK